MARKKRWTDENPGIGREVVHLSSWSYFDDYVRQEMLEYRNYIWRGQCSAEWRLEPTLDRILRKQNRLSSTTARRDHLKLFQYASRGRRGSNPPAVVTENDWWALGQHYGLATPLLDWTTSPFVAAYFAFMPEENDGAERRAVFALAKNGVEDKSQEIEASWTSLERAPIVELVEPLSDENARLVSQGGLFTRAPDGVDLESWVSSSLAGGEDLAMLLKITIPASDREIALRSLKRMNINHLSLFPDLYGASKFSNLHLLIDGY